MEIKDLRNAGIVNIMKGQDVKKESLGLIPVECAPAVSLSLWVT